MEIYKFTQITSYSYEQISESKAAKLRFKIDNGEKLTRDDKNWITDAVNQNTYSKWGVPVCGWMIPFNDVLKRYLIRTLGNDWHEVHAIDKTSLREYWGGKIDEIVEIPKRNN